MCEVPQRLMWTFRTSRCIDEANAIATEPNETSEGVDLGGDAPRRSLGSIEAATRLVAAEDQDSVVASRERGEQHGVADRSGT